MSVKNYDVAVAGAGVAGIAAAIAAARQGAKTALVEKQCLLGGLATSGLIYVYLPLCDGCGNQIIYGLSEEMIRRCTEYGPFDVPEKWGGPAGGFQGIPSERFRCSFSPAGFTLTLDKMLAEANVDLWLDSVVCGAEKDGDTLQSITVCNTSGMTKINAKCFIDATGGAYLAKLAGTEVITAPNYVTPWVIEMAEKHNVFPFTESLHIQGAWENPSTDSMDTFDTAKCYDDCFNGRAISNFVRDSWKLIRYHYDKFKTIEERQKNYPVHLAAMPQLRKIARIDALYNLTDADNGRRFEDSVGLTGDWRKAKDVWDTPYRSLIPKNVRNLLAAGRCIGTCDGDAWEVFRVIPTAAMTGESAGIAAALSAMKNITPQDLNYEDLKKALDTVRS